MDLRNIKLFVAFNMRYSSHEEGSSIIYLAGITLQLGRQCSLLLCVNKVLLLWAEWWLRLCEKHCLSQSEAFPPAPEPGSCVLLGSYWYSQLVCTFQNRVYDLGDSFLWLGWWGVAVRLLTGQFYSTQTTSVAVYECSGCQGMSVLRVCCKHLACLVILLWWR